MIEEMPAFQELDRREMCDCKTVVVDPNPLGPNRDLDLYYIAQVIPIPISAL